MNEIGEKVWLSIAAIGVWLAGESGRAVVAGAAGGVLRWLMQDQRRVRDGIVSVVGGVVASVYLGSVVAAILSSAVGPVAGAAPSGFIAGLAGMSLAKIIVAIVETQAHKMTRGRE